MNPSHVQLPEAIVQVQQRLEQWRATKANRTKLPETFWQSATELARQHGLNPTAKALRLDYTALKRRVQGVSATGPESSSAVFVELTPPPAGKLEEYVIEFESAQGSKMRIQWKASAPPDWSNLLRAWRDAER